MKRPYLSHFTAIARDYEIAIRASVSLKEAPGVNAKGKELQKWAPSFPLQSLNLLSSDETRVLIIGLTRDNIKVYQRNFDSDRYGSFDLKIPAIANDQRIEVLQIYDVGQKPGLQLLLGTFFPIKMLGSSKIVVSDFDKTLVDTAYSTLQDMYYSLSRPITHFPTVTPSVELLKQCIEKDYQAFILSASPHFYENAIRDWLYQNEIYTASIFLKDYRKVFSFSEAVLTPKDLKTQGFYKLNHLVNILLMTGIPDQLILMGDGFESDSTIYLTMRAILVDGVEPWKAWNDIKRQQEFRLNTQQNTRFLNKFYQLGTLLKNKEKRPEVDIHIRVKAETKIKIGIPQLADKRDVLNIYQA